MFDDDNNPVGELCFQDCDTIKSRWPFKALSDVLAQIKGGDARLVAQILHLTRVKLGRDAKHFLSQDVMETIGVGIRWEQPAIPIPVEEFQDKLQTNLLPENVAGLEITSMTDQHNNPKRAILIKDDSAPPRVYMWHEQRLDLTETKFSQSQQLAAGQGKEIWNHLAPKLLPSSATQLPSFGEVQKLVQQTQASASGSDAMAGATGSLLNTTGGQVHMRAMGAHAALLLDAQPPSTPVSSGAASGGKGRGGRGRGRGQSAVAKAAPLALTSGGASEPAAASGPTRGSKRKAKEAEADQALPSVAACALGEGKNETRTQNQILYKCKQQADGKLQTRAMTVTEHQKFTKEYKLRVYAGSLAPGACQAASDSEFILCFGHLMKAEAPLPTRWFSCVLQRLFAKIQGQAKPWTQNVDAVVRLVTPRVSGAPVPADGEDVSAEKWPMPTGLADIPLKRLSAADRWEVTSDFLRSELFPQLLPEEEKARPILAALRQELLQLAATAESSQHVESVVSALDVTCIHFQPEPITQDQFALFTKMRGERCPDSLLSLRELMKDGWWAKTIRTTLGFCMKEVQNASLLKTAVQGLTSDGDDIQARAWETITSGQCGLQQWLKEMRPEATMEVRQTIAAHLQKRLAVAAEKGETEAVELARLTTWMASSMNSEPWLALQREASQKTSELTAGSRWVEAKAAIKNLLHSVNTGDSAPGVEADSIDQIAKAATDKLSGCQGHEADPAEVEYFSQAIEVCMKVTSMTHNIVEAIEHMLPFISAEEDGHHTLKYKVLKQGVRLQNLSQEFQSSPPEPGNIVPALTRSRDAISSFKAACDAFGSSGGASALAAEADLGCWVFFELARERVSDLTQAWAATLAEKNINTIEAASARVQEDTLLWKGRLGQQSNWSHIVEEMQYHFWRTPAANEKKPIDKLDAACVELKTALDDYRKVCEEHGTEVNSVVIEAADQVMKKALCQITEEYFVRQIEQNPRECETKLMTRQTKIADKFQYEDIHELIRAEVKKRIGV